MARRIGIIGYEGVNALDLTGPNEVFASSLAQGPDGANAYQVMCLSPDGGPFRSGSGLRMAAECSLAQAPEFDTLIVPGGPGIRAPQVLEPIATFLRERAPTTRRLVSVCTGLIALGSSGLMDGRRATTHWRHVGEVAGLYPRIRLEPDAIFIRDGAFATSAGITAGIDLALALVEEDLGPTAALAVARQLVVYVKRSGGQRQYSEPLRFQARAAGRFADLAAWIPANLGGDLSVETLAGRVNCSPRHFARLFKEAFEASPAEYVEALRLAEAAERLVGSRANVDAVAASVGYASGDVFRRAFERRFGVSPSLYRARFSSEAAA
ncbi:MAG TPA: helix-turn-helix domain-containing protein [Phenylobacterium sp.]|uniref:GlxA family transcriptional regulator n=1 Tax=Phenylobacterium sp. TaxID=1871053 RepID=UPI002D756FDE|nr:helix-turn-helix domain-containing protein [Phenylobacterium sp.]HZZ70200.1 helix-turn-helix domain-containing protein [Phenylobacterium sp.]